MSRESELRLAVIGDPVAHSQSPRLQHALLARYGRAGSYTAICVPADEVDVRLPALLTAGFHGLNVTTPLKEAVLRHVVSADPLVEVIGAVNTLTATPAGWHGANTDGVGAVAAVRDVCSTSLHEVNTRALSGLRVLVLGVGPTARAAAAALRDAGAEIYLWNRTAQRADAVAHHLGVQIWRANMAIDLAFSTLPPAAELSPEIIRALRAVSSCIDANYGPRATLAAVLERPITTGETMLAAQAEASLNIWLAAYS